ncbi:hypothetical protein [Burkholderia ubonensis]|uniref:hypothetical protein n=1 Tax=Burkholderia ubonensis TaxID=101571 RepID=UPI0007577337|nr:hypothetical protein [Burkholderia ubonensis]KVW47641.1 hypothetical protein WK95_04805 [Burkholderia ubonensis]
MKRQHLETACAVFMLCLGMLAAATTIVGVVRHFSPVPFWDQWDGGVQFYMNALNDPVTAFFQQHNEHRLAFPKLFYFADIRYFGGRNVSLLIVNLLFALLVGIALYRVISRDLPERPAARAIVAGTLLILAFSFVQRENFNWGFQNQWFAIYLFAFCAFHSLERSADTRTGHASPWLATALTCATLATISMASGLLVFPTLIAFGLYLRLPRTTLATLIVATIAAWALYFHHWTSPGGASLTASMIQHPGGVLKFVILYLGAPFHYALPGRRALVLLCGCVLLGGALLGIWIALTATKRPRAVTLLAMSVFLIGNAVITAAGRYIFGLDAALSSRYTTSGLIAFACVAFFLWLNLSRRIPRATVAVVLMLYVAVVANGQKAVRESAHDEVYRKSIGGLALRSHVYDAAYTSALYPDSSVLRSTAQAAERSGLSIFAADNTDYPPLPERVQSDTACEGQIDIVKATETPGVLAAQGWAFDSGLRRYASSVLLTDATSRVLGQALTGERRDDVAAAMHTQDPYGGWLGFFKMPPDRRVRAFGVLAPGRYCALRGEIDVPAPVPSP